MSKSYKKPIVKDRGLKDVYNRTVRRTQANSLAKIKLLAEDELEDFEVENPKTIMNDYDYSDYTFDMRDYDEDDEYKIKASRK